MAHSGLGQRPFPLLPARTLSEPSAPFRDLHAHSHKWKALTQPRSSHPRPTGAFGSQSVDAAVLALQDTLTTSLYALSGAFGDGLAKVLQECKAQPAFGSSADAAALLQGVLKGQE